MTRLGWWWNKSWGTSTRRDVWLDLDEAQHRFVIRWRTRDLGRDHVYWTTSPAQAIAALRKLLGEDKSGWQERLSL